MNRMLVVLAASAALASGSALACNDMKVTDGGDGGTLASHDHARATPAATTEKATEAPLVVKQKQAPARKTTASSKPLPQGTAIARTGG